MKSRHFILSFMACALMVLISPQVRADNQVQRGEQIYVRCAACHALTYDRVGPRHCGLIGRLAGSVSGFAYSEAMKRSRIVWSGKTLERFLTNPMKMVPGTIMTYDGVPNKADRDDLIAYLQFANRSAACAGH